MKAEKISALELENYFFQTSKGVQIKIPSRIEKSLKEMKKPLAENLVYNAISHEEDPWFLTECT